MTEGLDNLSFARFPVGVAARRARSPSDTVAALPGSPGASRATGEAWESVARLEEAAPEGRVSDLTAGMGVERSDRASLGVRRHVIPPVMARRGWCDLLVQRREVVSRVQPLPPDWSALD
jgi:hypothetical protein